MTRVYGKMSGSSRLMSCGGSVGDGYGPMIVAARPFTQREIKHRKVAPLYEPLHPAVLTAVSCTVQAAKRAGKRVSMCGEMAADPLCTLLLLGMGLDELSMEPFFVPVIKQVIRSLSYAQAQRLTQEVLRLETVQAVKGRLFEELKQLEKMYKADDLVEDTEEIILRRQRFALESAEYGLEVTKENSAYNLKTAIPREAAKLQFEDRVDVSMPASSVR